MESRFIEVTNGPRNWGKFLVMRFTHEEWEAKSQVADPSGLGVSVSLLRAIGWNPHQLWVLDLQTCEGAAFSPGGLASADLQKHKVWACPMFQPMLEWLYQQDVSDLSELPSLVDLPDAPFAFSGYR